MGEIYRPDPEKKEAAASKAGASRRGVQKGGEKRTDAGGKRIPKRRSKLAATFFKLPPVVRIVLLVLVSIALLIGLVIGLWWLYTGIKAALIHYGDDFTPMTSIPGQTETIDANLTRITLPDELQYQADDLIFGKGTSGDPDKYGQPLICDTKDVKNILLIGVDGGDNRGEDIGLSDTMIILTINKKNKVITLTSLERDIVVTVPGYGRQKLNAAHAVGGAELLLKTLKLNFNIEIVDYARVSFGSFIKMVNRVGGLDLEMTKSEVRIMNKYLEEINRLYGREEGTDTLTAKAGTYHLNGYQALAYCRNRYSDNDFGRMGRQRKIIELAIQKAKKLGPLELDALLNDVLPEVKTNMSKDECHALIFSAPLYLGYELKKGAMPGDGEWTDGIATLGSNKDQSVVVLKNQKKSLIKLYEAIYGEKPN